MKILRPHIGKVKLALKLAQILKLVRTRPWSNFNLVVIRNFGNKFAESVIRSKRFMITETLI